MGLYFFKNVGQQLKRNIIGIIEISYNYKEYSFSVSDLLSKYVQLLLEEQTPDYGQVLTVSMMNLCLLNSKLISDVDDAQFLDSFKRIISKEFETNQSKYISAICETANQFGLLLQNVNINHFTLNVNQMLRLYQSDDKNAFASEVKGLALRFSEMLLRIKAQDGQLIFNFAKPLDVDQLEILFDSINQIVIKRKHFNRAHPIPQYRPSNEQIYLNKALNESRAQKPALSLASPSCVETAEQQQSLELAESVPDVSIEKLSEAFEALNVSSSEQALNTASPMTPRFSHILFQGAEVREVNGAKGLFIAYKREDPFVMSKKADAVVEQRFKALAEEPFKVGSKNCNGFKWIAMPNKEPQLIGKITKLPYRLFPVFKDTNGEGETVFLYGEIRHCKNGKKLNRYSYS